jgi:lipopolysaccharide transport system permease protein
VWPTWHIVWLPAFTLLASVSALGAGLWLSAANVQFRDIKYVMPFLIQLWMFGTPIAYSSNLLPDSWRIVYGLNPMVGVVDGFRWALLGTSAAPGYELALSAAVAVVMLVSGAFYFRRMERSFADVV